MVIYSPFFLVGLCFFHNFATNETKTTIAIAELDKQQIDIFHTTRFNIKYIKRDEKINCYYHYDHCRH